MTAAEWAEAIATEAREAIGMRGGGLPWGDSPYDSKTPAEVVHDYAVTRGDLVEQYARDQLASWIERYAEARLAQLTADLAAARSALAACRQVAHERAEAGRGES